VTFEQGSRQFLIGDNAFRSSSIQTIRIPASVRILGRKCFCLCTSLSRVSFEQDARLSSIGDSAFSHSSIRTICVPVSVERLGKQCFSYCTLLTDVTFERNPSCVSVGSKAFAESPHVRIVFPSGENFSAEQVWGLRVSTFSQIGQDSFVLSPP
jgi:hypothetical protein